MAKILLTLLVVGGVVLVTWMITRRNEAGRVASRARRKRVAPVEMEACPVCGTFVQPGGEACGRTDCPSSR